MYSFFLEFLCVTSQSQYNPLKSFHLNLVKGRLKKLKITQDHLTLCISVSLATFTYRRLVCTWITRRKEPFLLPKT